MFYTYITKSEKDGTTYIGFTSDLRQRIIDHNAGKTKSVKHKIPLELIYYEAYGSATPARKREIELKTNSFRKKELFERLGLVKAPSSNGQDTSFSS